MALADLDAKSAAQIQGYFLNPLQQMQLILEWHRQFLLKQRALDAIDPSQRCWCELRALPAGQRHLRLLVR